MKNHLLSAFSILLCFQLAAQCPVPSTVAIAGHNCIGAALTVSSDVPALSISWTLNGTTTVATHTAAYPLNGTVIAGLGGRGPGASQLANPDRIFVSPDGTVYVPDLANNRVQKWLPGASTGITVAGGNGAGAGSHQLSRPTSVFVDADGAVYIADQTNGRIQKWLPGATSGITVAGGSYGPLDTPTDVFVDGQGNLFVSEQGASVVKKWSAGSTTPVVVAGGNGYGNSATQLSSPTGIFVDKQGDIYICDTDNNRIQKWAAGGSAGVTVAGANGFGSGADNLANPLEIYVDCGGTMYIADFNNNRVQKWTAGATSGSTISGNNGSGMYPINFNGPIGIFMDSLNALYVAEFYNDKVLKFTSQINSSYVPTLPGDYTATITYNGGSAVSAPFSIRASFTPAISITASSLSICHGTPVHFLANANTGTSSVFQWKKNGVNVGANDSTYIDSVLLAGDVITCTVSSSLGCLTTPSSTSNPITMKVHQLPVVVLDPTPILCEGTIRQLDGGNFISYKWNDGSTGRTLAVSTTGIYHVTVTDSFGCQANDTVKITTVPAPLGFLPPDTVFCMNSTLTLQPSGNYIDYLWNTGSATRILQITSPGNYSLEVTDHNNCKGKDSITILTKQCLKGFYIPTAFSPNQDGRNDRFKPQIFGDLKKYSFTIYNRWGQVIFHTNDINISWDGHFKLQQQETNVFIWTCSYQLAGEPARTEKGTVVLIR